MENARTPRTNPAPPQFEIVKRDLFGDRYTHVSTTMDRHVATRQAKQLSLAAPPDDVFEVYEQPTNTPPTSVGEPTGRLLYGVESESARVMAEMQQILAEDTPLHHHPNNGGFYPNCLRCRIEAAVPDLLAACRAVLAWADSAGALPHCSPTWPDIEAQTRAAIHKATSDTGGEA